VRWRDRWRWELLGAGCVELLFSSVAERPTVAPSCAAGTGSGEACAGVGMVVLKTRVSEGCVTFVLLDIVSRDVSRIWLLTSRQL
jgi:hypothetical protein